MQLSDTITMQCVIENVVLSTHDKNDDVNLLTCSSTNKNEVNIFGRDDLASCGLFNRNTHRLP